jgi:hypothetical protein
MRLIRSTLGHWLPLALVCTALCLLVYGAVQQDLRMGGDDPQIQLAEDAADILAGGALAGSVVPTTQIDVSRSLAPFVIVYDGSGKVLASSGLLHGQVPALPPGVLNYVRQHGQDRVTWQPEPGVRIAAVVARFDGSQAGSVLAGRSLREVEKREDNLLLLCSAALLVTLGASLLAVALCEWLFHRRPSSRFPS